MQCLMQQRQRLLSPKPSRCVRLLRPHGEERGPKGVLPSTRLVLIAFQNAFCHLARGTPLEAALIETVGQGGDTDTNGAICGALLGVRQGRMAIPVRWFMPVLACRAIPSFAGRPRPSCYVPLLAEALLASRR
jgi:hypothetical protein